MSIKRLERTGGEAGCHVRAAVAAGRSTARWAAFLALSSWFEL